MEISSSVSAREVVKRHLENVVQDEYGSVGMAHLSAGILTELV